MSSQVTGICIIKVNGKILRSKEGAKIKLGGKERTAVTGHSVYGYSEKVVPAEIEATIADTRDTDLREMSDWVGARVLFETDTGKTYLVTNAFTTEPVELTGGEGDATLKMMGDPAIEQ